MSAVLQPNTACNCSVWTPANNEVRYCGEHHRYYRGAKELFSVTRVLKSTFPVKADYTKADPAKLENARLRGVELDTLFSTYVNGTLTEIPAGIRTDVANKEGTGLFQKLVTWWDKQKIKAKAQVVLANHEIAGTADLRGDDLVLDIKTVYNVEKIYELQVGMYGLLCEKPPKRLGIIHVTKRFHEPKLIEVNAEEAMADAKILVDMWRMTRRRVGDQAMQQETQEL